MTSIRLEAENERELSPQDEMADVRKVIDALYDEIVALLAKRQRQIERAARVKPLLEIRLVRVPDPGRRSDRARAWRRAARGTVDASRADAVDPCDRMVDPRRRESRPGCPRANAARR